LAGSSEPQLLLLVILRKRFTYKTNFNEFVVPFAQNEKLEVQEYYRQFIHTGCFSL